MKTVILYESTHHENTLKLVNAIAKRFDVDTIDITKSEEYELDGYDTIGFAAGIAFSKFYEKTALAAKRYLPDNKKVFFIYTCGRQNEKYTQSMRNIAKEKNCTVLGEYSCPGFDTYGPFKIVGGLNKNHPDGKDIDGAVAFFASISGEKQGAGE